MGNKMSCTSKNPKVDEPKPIAKEPSAHEVHDEQNTNPIAQAVEAIGSFFQGGGSGSQADVDADAAEAAAEVPEDPKPAERVSTAAEPAPEPAAEEAATDAAPAAEHKPNLIEKIVSAFTPRDGNKSPKAEPVTESTEPAMAAAA